MHYVAMYVYLTTKKMVEKNGRVVEKELYAIMQVTDDLELSNGKMRSG